MSARLRPGESGSQHGLSGVQLLQGEAASHNLQGSLVMLNVSSIFVEFHIYVYFDNAVWCNMISLKVDQLNRPTRPSIIFFLAKTTNHSKRSEILKLESGAVRF